MHKLATGTTCMAVSKYLGDRLKAHPEDSHKIRRFIVLAGRQPFKLRLTDDSMAPFHLPGTEINVRPYTGERFGLVVAMVDNKILCRQLVQRLDGLYLMAINPEYPPIAVDYTVHLLGKAFSVEQRF